jgi:hypothetical protein
MSESELITQDEHGTPLRWRSPAGVMHAAERICAGAARPE